LDNFWAKGVGEELVASRNSYSKASCSGKKTISMANVEENKMDPSNIGIYAIEMGLVGAIIYGIMVLPTILKPMP
jgi:hypothetical protein